jgi:transcriptional regulator with XRE-family HTH domain
MLDIGILYYTINVYYMIHFHLPFAFLRRASDLSERSVADAGKISRGTLRQVEQLEISNVTARSLSQVAEHFNRDVDVVLSCAEIFSEYSSVALFYKIERDGFDSWATHLFDLVDEFRRTLDTRLILLPPPKQTDLKLIALVASTVKALCDEVEIAAPSWACKRYYLPVPWFVSEMNSLKASALLESPLPYRANNIFVLNNFLERA